MARNNIQFYLLSAVFCVITGSALSLIACNELEVQKCTSTQNDYGHCRWFGDIVQCLQNIERNCSDDKLITYMNSAVEVLSAKSRQCDGMKDGSCFAQELRDCEEIAPYWQKYQIDHSEEGRNKYCGSFMEKVSDAKACIVKIKTQCVTEHTDKSGDRSIKTLEDMENLCSKYVQ